MKPTTRTQLTTAISLLLAFTTNAELQLYDDRPDFNAAAPHPTFVEDFESFHLDVLLDRIPTPVLAGSVVISGDSSHQWPWSIDSPNDGYPFVYPQTASGFGGITIPGEETFISGDANTYFTGILKFDFPQSRPPVHAFGLDFNGASGAANALAIPFYVGFRVTTADGEINTGRLADIHGTDVLGDSIPMPENGFFGVRSPGSPIVSVELYPMETDYDFLNHIRPNGEPLLGAGETYAVDNLTVALADSDADGMPDAFEHDHGLDPASDDSVGDLDDDGRTNLEEFRNRTNPTLADTDGDGIDDNTETLAGSDPTNRNDPNLFDLYIDFNSITDNTPSMGAPYRDYDARDTVADDFTTKAYTAFGTTVTLTPTWPDTSSASAQRMMGSTASPRSWDSAGLDLLNDFLGVDTTFGNGDYDGTTGTPSRLDLNLGGLPTGTYTWTSMHHDVLYAHTEFITGVSTDGGASFNQIGTFQMTHGKTESDPFDDNIVWAPAPELLSSTVDTTFEADGSHDVIVRFIPLSNTGPDKRLFGINGFQLVQTATPEVPLEITRLHLDSILGSVTLNWSSTPGKTYSVETTTSLAPADWQPLATDIPAPTQHTTHTHEFPDSQLPRDLFVRVRQQ